MVKDMFPQTTVINRLKYRYLEDESELIEIIDKDIRLEIYLLNKINHIQTRYCCSGHIKIDERKKKYWSNFYIMFVVDQQGFEYIQNIYLRITQKLGSRLTHLFGINIIPRMTDSIDESGFFNSVILTFDSKKVKNNIKLRRIFRTVLIRYLFENNVRINLIDILRILRLN